MDPRALEPFENKLYRAWCKDTQQHPSPLVNERFHKYVWPLLLGGSHAAHQPASSNHAAGSAGSSRQSSRPTTAGSHASPALKPSRRARPSLARPLSSSNSLSNITLGAPAGGKRQATRPSSAMTRSERLRQRAAERKGSADKRKQKQVAGSTHKDHHAENAGAVGVQHPDHHYFYRFSRHSCYLYDNWSTKLHVEVPGDGISIDMRGRNLELHFLSAFCDALNALSKVEVNKQRKAGAVVPDSAELCALLLAKNHVGDRGCRVLAHTLEQFHPELSFLDVRACGIGHNGARLLFKALRKSKVRTLLISNMTGYLHNTLGHRGFEALGTALGDAKCTLQELFIAHGAASQGISRLADGMQVNSSLITLDLRANSFDGREITLLFDALAANEHVPLQNLLLADSPVPGVACTSLVEAICNLKALKLIDAASCFQDSFVDFANAVYRAASTDMTCTATTLVFNNNSGDVSDMVHMMQSLLGRRPVFPKLSVLSMESCSITAQMFRQFVPTLSHSHTLTSINLRDNALADKGCKYVADVIKRNTTLKEVVLSGNGIHEQGGRTMANLILTARHLESLDLEENFLGNAGGRAITTALALIERTMAKAPVPYPIDEESVDTSSEPNLAECPPLALAPELHPSPTLHAPDAVGDVKIDLKRAVIHAQDHLKNTGPTHTMIPYLHEYNELVDSDDSDGDAADSRDRTSKRRKAAKERRSSHVPDKAGGKGHRRTRSAMPVRQRAGSRSGQRHGAPETEDSEPAQGSDPETGSDKKNGRQRPRRRRHERSKSAVPRVRRKERPPALHSADEAFNSALEMLSSLYDERPGDHLKLSHGPSRRRPKRHRRALSASNTPVSSPMHLYVPGHDDNTSASSAPSTPPSPMLLARPPPSLPPSLIPHVKHHFRELSVTPAMTPDTAKTSAHSSTTQSAKGRKPRRALTPTFKRERNFDDHETIVSREERRRMRSLASISRKAADDAAAASSVAALSLQSVEHAELHSRAASSAMHLSPGAVASTPVSHHFAKRFNFVDPKPGHRSAVSIIIDHSTLTKIKSEPSPLSRARRAQAPHQAATDGTDMPLPDTKTDHSSQPPVPVPSAGDSTETPAVAPKSTEPATSTSGSNPLVHLSPTFRQPSLRPDAADSSILPEVRELDFAGSASSSMLRSYKGKGSRPPAPSELMHMYEPWHWAIKKVKIHGNMLDNAMADQCNVLARICEKWRQRNEVLFTVATAQFLQWDLSAARVGAVRDNMHFLVVHSKDHENQILGGERTLRQLKEDGGTELDNMARELARLEKEVDETRQAYRSLRVKVLEQTAQFKSKYRRLQKQEENSRASLVLLRKELDAECALLLDEQERFREWEQDQEMEPIVLEELALVIGDLERTKMELQYGRSTVQRSQKQIVKVYSKLILWYLKHYVEPQREPLWATLSNRLKLADFDRRHFVEWLTHQMDVKGIQNHYKVDFAFPEVPEITVSLTEVAASMGIAITAELQQKDEEAAAARNKTPQEPVAVAPARRRSSVVSTLHLVRPAGSRRRRSSVVSAMSDIADMQDLLSNLLNQPADSDLHSVEQTDAKALARPDSLGSVSALSLSKSSSFSDTSTSSSSSSSNSSSSESESSSSESSESSESSSSEEDEHHEHYGDEAAAVAKEKKRRVRDAKKEAKRQERLVQKQQKHTQRLMKKKRKEQLKWERKARRQRRSRRRKHRRKPSRIGSAAAHTTDTAGGTSRMVVSSPPQKHAVHRDDGGHADVSPLTHESPTNSTRLVAVKTSRHHKQQAKRTGQPLVSHKQQAVNAWMEKRRPAMAAGTPVVPDRPAIHSGMSKEEKREVVRAHHQARREAEHAVRTAHRAPVVKHRFPQRKALSTAMPAGLTPGKPRRRRRRQKTAPARARTRTGSQRNRQQQKAPAEKRYRPVTSVVLFAQEEPDAVSVDSLSVHSDSDPALPSHMRPSSGKGRPLFALDADKREHHAARERYANQHLPRHRPSTQPRRHDDNGDFDYEEVYSDDYAMPAEVMAADVVAQLKAVAQGRWMKSVMHATAKPEARESPIVKALRARLTSSRGVGIKTEFLQSYHAWLHNQLVRGVHPVSKGGDREESESFAPAKPRARTSTGALLKGSSDLRASVHRSGARTSVPPSYMKTHPQTGVAYVVAQAVEDPPPSPYSSLLGRRKLQLARARDNGIQAKGGRSAARLAQSHAQLPPYDSQRVGLSRTRTAASPVMRASASTGALRTTAQVEALEQEEAEELGDEQANMASTERMASPAPPAARTGSDSQTWVLPEKAPPPTPSGVPLSTQTRARHSLYNAEPPQPFAVRSPQLAFTLPRPGSRLPTATPGRRHSASPITARRSRTSNGRVRQQRSAAPRPHTTSQLPSSHAQVGPTRRRLAFEDHTTAAQDRSSKLPPAEAFPHFLAQRLKEKSARRSQRNRQRRQRLQDLKQRTTEQMALQALLMRSGR